MATGVYGTRIASNITVDDVEIFYSYSPTRNSNDVNLSDFRRIDSTLLSQANISDNTDGYDNILEGVYNLKLPVQYFNSKGYYTIYIRPKEIPVVLLDVGVLSSFPDVKGLVVDITSISDTKLRASMSENNELVGYRVVYFDDNGKRKNYYRIVTSNNRCEPVVQNMSDTNQKAIRYRYNESSTLTFITVTPSAATTFKPNAVPYIGSAAQKVLFANTKFEPVMIDLELVDHDADTISTMLEGSQLRNLDNGLITTFTDNGEIYNQVEMFSLKDSETGNPIYEVRKNKTDSIDFSETINDKN